MHDLIVTDSYVFICERQFTYCCFALFCFIVLALSTGWTHSSSFSINLGVMLTGYLGAWPQWYKQLREFIYVKLLPFLFLLIGASRTSEELNTSVRQRGFIIMIFTYLQCLIDCLDCLVLLSSIKTRFLAIMCSVLYILYHIIYSLEIRH